MPIILSSLLAAACGSSPGRPSALDDEAFQRRFSDCETRGNLAGPGMLLDVQAWFEVTTVGDETKVEARTESRVVTTTALSGTSGSPPRSLTAHETVWPGVIAAIGDPGVEGVFVGTGPGPGDPYVIAALITTSDGRTLAPGMCSFHVLLGRPPASELRHATLRRAIGALGGELAAVVDELA